MGASPADSPAGTSRTGPRPATATGGGGVRVGLGPTSIPAAGSPKSLVKIKHPFARQNTSTWWRRTHMRWVRTLVAVRAAPVVVAGTACHQLHTRRSLRPVAGEGVATQRRESGVRDGGSVAGSILHAECHTSTDSIARHVSDTVTEYCNPRVVRVNSSDSVRPGGRTGGRRGSRAGTAGTSSR